MNIEYKAPVDWDVLERRQMLLMERRHEMAVAGVRLERLVFESQEDAVTPELDEKIQKELLDIHPSLRPYYLKAVEAFFKQKKRVSDFYAALLREYGNSSQSGPAHEKTAGAFFFHSITGELPLGAVELTKYHGYLLVRSVTDEDYAALAKCEGSIGVMGIETHIFQRKEYQAPFIYIRPAPSHTPEQIIQHEEQHFINNSLLGGSQEGRDRPFTSIARTKSVKGELGGPERMRRARYFRLIKDEVLAHIKEGESLEQTLSAIQGEAYHPLFHVFDTLIEQRHALDLTKEIIQLLATTPLWNAGEDGRALLVNILYPISFEELLKWIPVINRFYGKYMVKE